MAHKPSFNKPVPEKWQQIPCPICDSVTFAHLFTKDREPFVKCNDCGLVLINPRPVPQQSLMTYDHAYSEHYANKANKKLRRCRRWVNRVKKLVSTGKWLDVGCSIGLVVMAANEAGFEGHGVDVEGWGVDYARNQLGLSNIQQGFLEDQKYADGFFSVISLYDVIEHVPDLNLLVKELKRILAANGIIDIITPDINHWRVPRDLASWNEIKPSEHLYYFSKHTLARLLEKHGLRIMQTRFHFKPSLRVYAGHAA
jgi:2-polyprenyl-3-methyl-5-hydroxy-6-metoxy-1,4-benzoquinol methylase